MNSEKITLLDIANALAEKQGLSKKEAEAFVKCMFDLVEEALANEKYVKIKGWGMFKLIEVNSRESINVNTGERIEIQGHTKISFTPESSLKELINKPFAHFETVMLNEGTVLDDTNEVIEGEEEKKNEVIEQVDDTIVPIAEPIAEPISPNVDETIEQTVEEVVETVEESDKVEDVVEIIEEKSEISVDEPQPSVEESDVVEEIPTVIESVSEEAEVEKEEIPENIPMDSSKPDEEKTSKGLLIITIFLILIILLGAYWLFSSPDETPEVLPVEPIIEEVIETTDSVIIDTMEVEQIADKVEEKQTEPVIQTPKRLVATISDTTDYVIVGTKTTHILESGETIIRVALKHFGDKNYWPYIAKHNESRIKDANNVPIGTELLIPELKPKQ